MWNQSLYDLHPTTNVRSENGLRIFLISHFLYLFYFSNFNISTAPKRKIVIKKRCFYYVHFDVTTGDIISKLINKSDKIHG